MPNQPRIENRPEMHYLAISCRLKMEEIPAKLPPLIPELTDWLKKHRIEPAGDVFFNYLNFTNGEMTAEVGIPVKAAQTGDDHVKAGKFPAGKYAVLTHMGDYKDLPKANMELVNWAKENKIELQNPCIEFYPTDPAELPNPTDWQTDIMRRVKDA